jgi:hypothetical protein
MNKFVHGWNGGEGGREGGMSCSVRERKVFAAIASFPGAICSARAAAAGGGGGRS